MPSLVTLFLGVSSLLLILLSFNASTETPECLSPQGCRMSYMWPSYTRLHDFNATWTPLAERYSLWLYREARWEPNELDNGVPVLFIPGNAGSSHQVRSIASSAARQYFSSAFAVNPEFSSRSLNRLDVYAVEFNEDLSAFHGSTIESEISYTSKAIDYILSLYPARTQVIVLGHSMGGIVATSLLPSPNISAIITMSTPHTLPPARFDSRMDALHDRIRRMLEKDPTPILSLCGGATDMMIPSESCILPPVSTGRENSPGDQTSPVTREPIPYRRTVFTSALEGAWTGVGHREMVWCHQVRWRVARVALEMGTADTPTERGAVLDRWLRDGSVLPTLPGDSHAESGTATYRLTELDKERAHEELQRGKQLLLISPQKKGTYLLPVPRSSSSSGTSTLRFTLFVSQGTLHGLAPHHPNALRVSVYGCDNAPICQVLKPTTLKLIPNPQPGSVFPAPSAGVDESDGVVLFELVAPYGNLTSFAVQVEEAAGTGWVYGGFSTGENVVTDAMSMGSLISGGGASLSLPKGGHSHIQLILPRLLAHALVVYRISPVFNDTACLSPMLSPILVHNGHAAESHYFPLMASAGRRILLHPHLPAPYISSSGLATRGVELDILAVGSDNCDSRPDKLIVSIDWYSTLGRIASRYPTTLVTWTVGVVSVLIFLAWSSSEATGAPLAPVSASLTQYGRVTLPKLMAVSFVIGLLPLPSKYYLGTNGEFWFTFIAPLVLFTSSGLVCVIWWILAILMWPIGRMGIAIFGKRKEDFYVRRSTVVSMVLIFGLIFLFIPWQVAYLGCWFIHLYTCATGRAQSQQLEQRPHPGSTHTPGTESIPLTVRPGDGSNEEDDDHRDHRANGPNDPSGSQQRPRSRQRGASESHLHKSSDQDQNEYFLLLMTLLLPLAAPVLVVWVRTLATAGLTTPFDGDHFFVNVAPFLVFVDFASWTPVPVLQLQSFERHLSTRWAVACLAIAAFFLGPRQGYSCFDAARVVMGVVVVVRIGRRYWGGRSWASEDNTADNNKARVH